MIVLIIDGGTAEGVGVVLMLLATVPLVAGLALSATAFVNRRSRKGKPFA